MGHVRITDCKGFHFTFENGWTISVQFGPGSYCDNYDMGFEPASYKKAGEEGSSTAEIAIWKDKIWHDFGGDTVKGYVPITEVFDWMKKVETWT